jgi:hypothetical protein
MTTLAVRELKQTEWNHWDEWLAVQPWSSPFSSAWWLDANCRALGSHPLLLGVFEGEDLVGGVALRTMDVGSLHIVRSPSFYSPIVLAEGSARSRQQILCALLDSIAQRRLIVTSIKCTADLIDLRSAVWKGWRLRAEWTIINDLSKWSPESQPAAAERKQARKAMRAGVTARVEEPDAELLHTLMGETMARHSTAVSTPQAVIETLMKAAGDHGLFVVARNANGVALGAAYVMFQGRHTAYGIWNGNSVRGLAVNSPVLLYTALLTELQSHGFQFFDWCGGGLPGVSDFKLEFGGRLVTKLSIDRSPLWFKAAWSARLRLLTARSAATSAIVRAGRLHRQTDAS